MKKLCGRYVNDCSCAKQKLSISAADVIQYQLLGNMAQILDDYKEAAKGAAMKDPALFELWSGFLEASAEKQKMRIASVADQCKIFLSQITHVTPTSPLQDGSDHPIF